MPLTCLTISNTDPKAFRSFSEPTSLHAAPIHMYICIYVCLYICIYIFMKIGFHMYRNIYVHIHVLLTNTETFQYMQIHKDYLFIYICINKDVFICTCLYRIWCCHSLWPYIYLNWHTYIYIYTYIYMYVCMHICINKEVFTCIYKYIIPIQNLVLPFSLAFLAASTTSITYHVYVWACVIIHAKFDFCTRLTRVVQTLTSYAPYRSLFDAIYKL
jgi:hypothetical protein